MKNLELSANTFLRRGRPVGLSFVKSVAAVSITLALSGCLEGHDHDESGSNSSAAVEFGDAYWASLAAEYPEYPDGPFYATPPDARRFLGEWDGRGGLIDWPIIAAGAANMPYGNVMAWASWKTDDFAGPNAQENTHAVMYDPINHTFSNRTSSTHDMFCSGVSMLEDGRVFIAGGGHTVSTASVFGGGNFSEIESMNQTRWYPTSTTLASGQVVTSLGNNQSPYPEIWTDGQGWDLMENISLQSILDEEDILYRDWFPALNVAPDGSLIHPGHMPEVFSIDLEGDHDSSVHSHGNRDNDSRLYNTTVMYDVGKMLVAGGGYGENETTQVGGDFPLKFTLATETAYTMDLNGAEPVITPTGSMDSKRSMQNSVVLPNGKVLVIGGTREGVQFSDRNSVHAPEIWDPATGEWTPVASHSKPRNYHSIALLLKDATVLSAGGGLCGDCQSNQQTGRIFTPPYLFDAAGELIARPAITGGTAEALPGSNIVLQGSDDIVQFNMVRLVAITHHHTTDQRFIPTESVKTGVGQYQLNLHANANVLIPGYYWVFGLDAAGTPTTGHPLRIMVTPENVPAAASPTPKLAYEYYEKNLGALELPNFNALTPKKTGFIEEFSLGEKERNDHYSFRFKGKLIVPQAGEHTFYLASDDGSQLYINGDLVVDHNGGHGFESEEETGTVNLSAGLHYIEVQYFEATGGDALLVSWKTPVTPKRPLTSEHLSADINTDLLPVAEDVGAINYNYFISDDSELQNFGGLGANKSGLVIGFDTSIRERHENYGFAFLAGLTVAQEGEYTFYTTSGGVTSVRVNQTTLVNNDVDNPAATQQGSVTLPEGRHSLVVDFYANSIGDALAVEWSGPNFARQPIPLSALGIPLDTDGIFEVETDTGGTADSGTDTSGEGDGGTDTTGEGDSGTETSGEADSGAETGGEGDSGTETSGETDSGTDTGTTQKIKSGGAFGPLLMWILIMGLAQKASGQIQSARRQRSIR